MSLFQEIKFQLKVVFLINTLNPHYFQFQYLTECIYRKFCEPPVLEKYIRLWKIKTCLNRNKHIMLKSVLSQPISG